MERLNSFTGNTLTDDEGETRPGPRTASRQDPQTGSRVTIAAQSQAESGSKSQSPGASGGSGKGGRRARSTPPNPIERYIACFATARAAAEAAGISATMLRRMRVRGYVSTRGRALLMAQACGFKLKPAELLALTPGGR